MERIDRSRDDRHAQPATRSSRCHRRACGEVRRRAARSATRPLRRRTAPRPARVPPRRAGAPSAASSTRRRTSAASSSGVLDRRPVPRRRRCPCVPPVFIAAIGTPSALASMSTRLSDSGPREGNTRSGGVCEPADGLFVVDPTREAHIAAATRGRPLRAHSRSGPSPAMMSGQGRWARWVTCSRWAVPLFGASFPR